MPFDPLALNRTAKAAPAAAKPTSQQHSENRQAIQDAARTALDTNRTYVALATPTAAQTTAQVKALARQHNGLIRLLLGLLDGTT